MSATSTDIPPLIKYWTLALKQWIVSWVTDECLNNKYGDGRCDWLQLAYANELIGIMQCYQQAPAVDPCLTDSDMKSLFQQASAIINKQ